MNSDAQIPVLIVKGDGIGPEIMDAVLFILRASGAPIVPKEIEIRDATGALSPELWEELEQTKIMLKGPLITPQGSGHQSFNVSIRKQLGLFANVRPVRAFAPFVPTHHPDMDLVVIRENEEDVYAGIEYRQTADGSHGLKLATVQGCDRIVRFAFDFARRHGRRKVSPRHAFPATTPPGGEARWRSASPATQLHPRVLPCRAAL
jgi:isocitrate dehydrogenase